MLAPLHPFGGPPTHPAPPPYGFGPGLAALDPPCQHYQWYYSTPSANRDMQHAPQRIHDVLRACFHQKSGDPPLNDPAPLATWSAPHGVRA